MGVKHSIVSNLIIQEFSNVLQGKLRSITSHTASHRNPLDTIFDMNLIKFYVNLPKIIMKSEKVDMIFIYGVLGFHNNFNKFFMKFY